jgi:hypothetical protein
VSFTPTVCAVSQAFERTRLCVEFVPIARGVAKKPLDFLDELRKVKVYI